MSSEQSGLLCLRRRATRVGQCGTELMCRAGRAFVLEAMHDERMGKAELLRAMQEAAAAPPNKSTKRKAPSMVEKEARGENRKKAGASTSGARTKEASKSKQAPTPPTPSSEEPLDVPPVSMIAGASSSGKGPERPLPFDPSKYSLVESPSAIVATGYICNMAPDRDRRPLRKARNADVVGHFSTNLAATIEKKILPALNEKLGCEKTFTQYQSRLKWFKLRYNNYCKLMRHNSGFGCDSNTRKFTATEQVWEDYLN
ncbi:hypothetical protein F511_36821 [Dorcoceras hygrometricum]|uniref:Myb/SANT-like domain-containing protein n=1 Tax=Dorcoceras hygrometricum TaxID=472368 RepID=A0A2Z7A8F5_9LAMI|nr:hypothetical protein F511_36821 [Dorcoceras hygrometricum]